MKKLPKVNPEKIAVIHEGTVDKTKVIIKSPILIKEGTIGTCPSCKSTEVKRFIFFGRSIGCVNPKCNKYYKL